MRSQDNVEGASSPESDMPTDKTTDQNITKKALNLLNLIKDHQI